MKEYILLINTSDSKGLVYNVSKVLFANNLNIEQNAEYVDAETNKFFMRTVISGDVNAKILLKELTEVLPKESQLKLREKSKKDIVILATKESHVLGDLLIRYLDGELEANIKAVIANHDYLKDLVEKLPEKQFIRIHKSYIVSIKHIETLEGNLIEINKTQLPIGKSYKSSVEKVFGI